MCRLKCLVVMEADVVKYLIVGEADAMCMVVIKADTICLVVMEADTIGLCLVVREADVNCLGVTDDGMVKYLIVTDGGWRDLSGCERG